MAVGGGFVGHGKRQAVGDAQLLDHEVLPGGFFGDGVLHLQAGVDFEEGNRAAAADEEFDGARAHVAGALAHIARGPVQALALGVGEEGGGGFFDEFLVAPL